MHSLSKRFDAFRWNTPANVGPGAYDVNGEVGSYGQSYAPFLSLKPRDLSLSDKDAASLPAPNRYHPQMKTKIMGGTSMQSKAPRFSYLKVDYCEPYPPCAEGVDGDAAASSPRSGRMVKAAPRFKAGSATPTEPFIGVASGVGDYKSITEGNRMRKTAQLSEKCSPCILHGGLNLGKYRGVNFWRMTSRDAFDDTDNEPGPGDYDIGSFDLYVPISYTSKKWLKLHCGRGLHQTFKRCGVGGSPGIIPNPDLSTVGGATFKKPRNPWPLQSLPISQRYLDVLVQSTLRENFPAPNAYNVMKENPQLQLEPGKKTSMKEKEGMDSENDNWRIQFAENTRMKPHFKRRNIKHVVVHPFISSTPRFKLEESGPGPGDYEGYTSAFGVRRGKCLPGVAFLQRCARYQKVKSSPCPGPGDYDKLGMTDELLKRLRPRYCWLERYPAKNIGFGSSGSRTTDVVPAWAKDLPGPGDYDLKERQCSWKKKKRDCPRRQQKVPVARPQVGSVAEDSSRFVRSGSKGRAPTRAVTFGKRPCNKRQAGRRKRCKKQTLLPNPFDVRKGKREVEVTPGPALYFPERANAVLRRGVGFKIDSGTKRFPDIADAFPGPGQYQTVATEMLKRSFNVRIGRSSFVERRVRPARSRQSKVRSCGVALDGHSPSSSTRCRAVIISAPPPVVSGLSKRFSVTRGPDELY